LEICTEEGKEMIKSTIKDREELRLYAESDRYGGVIRDVLNDIAQLEKALGVAKKHLDAIPQSAWIKDYVVVEALCHNALTRIKSIMEPEVKGGINGK
jgi:hypothetical protein